MNIPTISIPAETIAQIGPIAVSNSMVTTITSSLIIIVMAFFIRRNAGVKPTRLQVAFELVLEYLLNQMTLAFGSEKRARKYFPLFMTVLLLLIVANQFTLLPFVESVVTSDGTSFFRTPTSHYSLTIGLAAFLLILGHVIAFATHPLRHIGNYVKLQLFFQMKSIKDLPMTLIEFGLGLLDIIGEFAKIISLATRLFGNMFAGGVVIAIVSGLMFATQFLVPIPFLILGILSGFVQAFVFTILSVLFISSTTNAVIQSNNQ
ncbi:hypothetical protein COU74_01185 [Candidatus Peregrinibacteria bacterium CG10_big_fil_rev_8_21_14_0_10_36_19]|nr:MAG: hypothetical protein COU74_01185 [Candidatus Peregrinibacteria bacterium CG10_big_fil_rev_8_21_14_0_10_36_19]